MASVTGKVTLKGQPLPAATITFVGKDSSSLSRAITDEGGKYELIHSAELSGAKLGEYSVSISTYKPADTDSVPPVPKVPEKVPARYNLQTELKAKVEAGDNVIDFPLEEGPVVQPDAAEQQRETQLKLQVPC